VKVKNAFTFAPENADYVFLRFEHFYMLLLSDPNLRSGSSAYFVYRILK